MVPRKAALLAFARQVAKMSKDGERLDEDGEPWEMPNDDAWETVHLLISQARGMLGIPDPPDLRDEEDEREPRYVSDIIGGAQADGLVVE